MDRKEAAKIRAHMDYIIENMDVTDFQNELVGNGLTLDTISKINELESVRDKNRKCLEYIMTSENGSYQVFLELLNKYNYFNIVTKLESGLPPEVPSENAEVSTPRIHVPENKRHIRLTQKDMVPLSGTVSPKGKLAWSICLGISKFDFDHIEIDYSHGPTQMMEILLNWRRKQGSGATLGVLMDRYNDALDNDVSIDIQKLENIIADMK